MCTLSVLSRGKKIKDLCSILILQYKEGKQLETFR